MNNNVKIIGTCPTCTRPIEHGDDTVPHGGKVYHEGCEPETPAIPPTKSEESQPVSLVTKQEGKKMPKDEIMLALLQQMQQLTAKVAELEARPAATPAPAVRKSKAEKGAPRPDVFYIIKGFPSEKRPPQCLKVFRAIAQAAPEGGKMTEMDIWNALMDGAHPSEKASKSVGSWNYRQTPFYIFKYYRGNMIEAEYVQGPFDVV